MLSHSRVGGGGDGDLRRCGSRKHTDLDLPRVGGERDGEGEGEGEGVGTCNWETKEKLRGGNVHGVDRMVKAMYDAVPNRRQLRDAVNAMYVTSIWIILFFTLAWQVGPAESAKSPAGEHTVTQWWTTEPMEC
eukprot:gene47277-13572_t